MSKKVGMASTTCRMRTRARDRASAGVDGRVSAMALRERRARVTRSLGEPIDSARPRKRVVALDGESIGVVRISETTRLKIPCLDGASLRLVIFSAMPRFAWRDFETVSLGVETPASVTFRLA